MENNLEEICGWKEISRKSNGDYAKCRKCKGYEINCIDYFILNGGKKTLNSQKAYMLRANIHDRSQTNRNK